MIGTQDFWAGPVQCSICGLWDTYHEPNPADHDFTENVHWPVYALTAAEQEAQEATGEFDLTDYRAAEGVYDDDEPDMEDCG